MRYSDVPTIREMLYQQFNARICLVDIYYIYKLAEKKAYANTVDDLLLPCVENRDEVRAFLERNGYGELIFDIVNHARVSDDLEDSLLAHFNQETVDVFKEIFVHPFDKEKSVVSLSEGLRLTTSSAMADIIRYPLSQFHAEITKACDLFMKGKKLNDEKDMKFYMESYSPSFYSQYAQYWVAERLDMLNYPSKICVV